MTSIRALQHLGFATAISAACYAGYQAVSRPQGLGMLAQHGQATGKRLMVDDEIVTGSIGPRDGAEPLPPRLAKPQTTISGTIKAGQQVTLTAEVNARIARFTLREGDRFRAGDIIVAFDCSRTTAEHNAAKAAYAAQKNNLKSLTYLARNGAAGQHAVQQARFETEKAWQEVNVLAARETYCTIRAPFDGRIAEKLAYSHEVASPNQPLVRIVDESAAEIQFLTPSRHLSEIRIGQKIDVRVDALDQTLAATVVQIAGSVDAASQTIRVVAQFDSRTPDMLSGMAGTALIVRGGE